MARGLVALLSMAFATVVRAKVHVTFKAGSRETLGVCYVGNETMRMTEWSEKDFEVLSRVLKPAESVTMDLPFEHSFVLRSSDHQFRAKVKVQESPEDKRAKHPYLLVVRNIMHEVPHKTISIEHTDVQAKVEPGKDAGYFTDILHWYEISMEDEVMFSVQLGHPQTDEL